MVNIDIFFTASVISKCKLDHKYPLIKKYNQEVVNFLHHKFRRYSDYQRIGRRLIDRCSKYCRKMLGMDYSSNPPTQLNFEQFMEKYLLKEARMFIVYFKKNLTDFACTKFLQEFIGEPVVDILNIFDRMNMKNDINHHIRNNDEVFQNVIKICNMHLLMYLSKLFYTIDIAMKSDSLSLLTTIYENSRYSTRYGSYRQITNLMVDSLKNETDISPIINDPDNEIIKNIMSSTDNSNQYISALNQIFDCKKKLYDLFLNKASDDMQEIFKKYPDIDALIGYHFVTKRVAKKDFVINRLLKIDDFFIIYFLGDNVNFNLVDNDIEQIKNLKMPTNKFTNSKIVIEI
ncbi:putative ORFan [Tupanvirus deep ocean]|uniref:ORFan n=2 Tax=Tupanvirus TaxID=2094720 RepID=A0AC62A7K6_9VIRU|nr:putative ORFan [Tupanvirus deep ocean]QKU33660.1 putative ORFan [Tupanvirus deep ocean]